MPSSSAQLLSAAEPGTVKRSLTFVVHGVGEQPKSTELENVTGGFLPLIRRRLDPRAIVSAHPADGDGPAEVLLQFDDKLIERPIDPTKYQARFIEVWWQSAFGAPGLGQMILGLFAILTRWGKTQAWGAKDGKKHSDLVGFILAFGFLLLRLVLNVVVFLPLLFFLTVGGAVYAILAFITATRTSPTGSFVIPRWVKTPLLRIFDVTTKVQPLVVEIGVVILTPVIIVLLALLWLFEAVLPRGTLGKLEALHLWLVKLITRSWGDLWLYTELPWQASRIRVRFEEQFVEEISHLDPDVETVTIIAHSMGSAIAYEALTGPRLRPLLDLAFGPDPITGEFGSKPRFHLITLGSALNIVWTVMDEPERHRFVAPLPSYVDWLNLWTYLDPYARQALRIPDDAYEVRPSVTYPDVLQPVRENEVINQQDMFSDHSSYWNNASQVVSPILDILTMGRVKEALRLDVPGRMFRVSILSFLKALAWSIPVFVFAGLFAYVHGFNEGNNWPGESAAGVVLEVIDRLVEATPGLAKDIVNVIVRVLPDPVLEILPDWMSDADGVTKKDIKDNLFSPFIIAGLIAAVAATVYSTAVKWFWDSWDRGHKYD